MVHRGGAGRSGVSAGFGAGGARGHDRLEPRDDHGRPAMRGAVAGCVAVHRRDRRRIRHGAGCGGDRSDAPADRRAVRGTH